MYRVLILLILFFKLEAQHFSLSICAIFQNEAEFLKEWIEFHKIQGVEHFYLYNNRSDDHFEQVLEPYIDSNEVTLIDWPFTYEPGETGKWLQIQTNAYTDCVRNFGKNTAWLAVIDTDEFLFCPNGETLVNFLKRYTRFGGVCAHWLHFGTSNVENIPEGSLMIEHLTKCSHPLNGKNMQVKTIVQPKYVLESASAHNFIYRRGFFTIDAYGNRVEGMGSPRITHNRIRINHYWTRTEQHFNEKKCQSRQTRRSHEDVALLRERADAYNIYEDKAILRFAPQLRRKMGFPGKPHKG